jgi:hypothetical protein
MKKLTRWIGQNWAVLFVAMLGLGWAAIVWASGWGWNPSGVAWDFDNTAKLGDSFGVLGTTMAAIAAYYAFRTYESARADSARLERQAAEPSYLNLLERRYDVLDRVRQHSLHLGMNAGEGPRMKSVETTGQAALDRIALGLRRPDTGVAKSMSERFNNTAKHVYGLSNLFRFTYHIIAYADRQFSTTKPSQPMSGSDPAYQYVRLLRAQMSDSELLLIALNCAYAEGREKFKPLVERYALLHNMRSEDIEDFGLEALFEASAFGVDGAVAERTSARVSQ